MPLPIRLRFLRPFRRLLLVGGLSTVVLLPVWSGLQMESAFGVVDGAAVCGMPKPYWLASDRPPPWGSRQKEQPLLRTATFNIHSGLGPDWRLWASRAVVEKNLRRIARHLASAAPANAPLDLIGLNEVDFHSRRSGWLDQAEFLAAELKRLTGYSYRVVRGETWRRDLPGFEVRFGNALLSRHPLRQQQVCLLGKECPGAGGGQQAAVAVAGTPWARLFGEQRGVIQARIDFHGSPVNVLVTHLEAFVMGQREEQAAEILQRYVEPGVATVLLGDLNAVPTTETVERRHFAADRTHDILTSGPLVDARVGLAAHFRAEDLSAWATFPAEEPKWPLDGALATAELMASGAQVIGELESDHRGLAVEYHWLGPDRAADHRQWHDGMRRRQFGRILACDFAMSGGIAGIEGEVPRRASWLSAATGFKELVGAFAQD